MSAKLDIEKLLNLEEDYTNARLNIMQDLATVIDLEKQTKPASFFLLRKAVKELKDRQACILAYSVVSTILNFMLFFLLYFCANK